MTPINESKRIRLIYAAILNVSLLWCGMIVGTPILQETAPKTAVLCRLFFSPICHQDADRSFRVAGRPLAVCARCTGIYAGFLAGVLVFPVLRKKHWNAPSRRIYLLAATPTAAEFGLTRFFLIPDSAVVRALTGLSIGAVVATCVMSAMFEIFQTRKS